MKDNKVFNYSMTNFIKPILVVSFASIIGTSSIQAATYEVIDKGAATLLKNTYSQQENSSGQTAISGTDIYNFPIQFQYLNEDDYDSIVSIAERDHESVFELSNIEDEIALRAGNPTANDLSWIIRFLQSRSSTRTYQKLGNIFAMKNTSGQTEWFNIFDVKFEGSENYTRSTRDFISGVTETGWFYGTASAPYLPYVYTVEPEDEEPFDIQNWRRDFSNRGFFSIDGGENIVSIIPPSETELPENQRFGGVSGIFDINDSQIAVGFGSTSINESAINFIFDVEDENGDALTSGCSIDSYLTAQRFTFDDCVKATMENQYNLSAIMWQLNEQGVVSYEILGQLVTPHEDDTREYISYAQAVNNDGVAVGYAHGWVDENETEPSATQERSFYAVVFKNGDVIDFTDDHSEYFDSRAFDINDAGIAVGHATTFVNGSQRTKFYYVDTNAETMEMILPDDYFKGSSSTARAINENGLIVGEGEVETHNDTSSNPRRRHGFLYNINNDTFTDLNDFLTCNNGYSIIEARAINNDNEISATAIVKAPRRDSKGEIMVDDNGDQLVEDVVRAVTLRPIDGEIENCSEVEETVERQGAGIGFASILLLIFVTVRRYFH